MRKLYHRKKCLSRFFTKIIRGRQIAAPTASIQPQRKIVGADIIRPFSLPLEEGGICEANDGGSFTRRGFVRRQLPQSRRKRLDSSLKREPTPYPTYAKKAHKAGCLLSLFVISLYVVVEKI